MTKKLSTVNCILSLSRKTLRGALLRGDKTGGQGNIDACIKNGEWLYARQNQDERKKLELISPQEIGLKNVEQGY